MNCGIRRAIYAIIKFNDLWSKRVHRFNEQLRIIIATFHVGTKDSVSLLSFYVIINR